MRIRRRLDVYDKRGGRQRLMELRGQEIMVVLQEASPGHPLDNGQAAPP